MQFSTFLQNIHFLPANEAAVALQPCMAPDRLRLAQDVLLAAGGTAWPVFTEREFTRFYYTTFLQDYLDALGPDIDSLDFARGCVLHYTVRLTLAQHALLHISTIDRVPLDAFALTHGEPEFASVLCVPDRTPTDDPGARHRPRHRASGIARRGSVLRPADFRYVFGSPRHLQARAGGQPISTLVVSCDVPLASIIETIDAFLPQLGADLFVLLAGRDEAVAAVTTQLARAFGQTRHWAQATAADPRGAYNFAHLTLLPASRAASGRGRGHAPDSYVATRPVQTGDASHAGRSYRYLTTREEIGAWADRTDIVRPAGRQAMRPPEVLLAPARFAEQMHGNFMADVQRWWQATAVDLPAATRVMFRDVRLVGCGHCFTCDGAVFDSQLNEADLPSFLAGAGVSRSDVHVEPDGSITSPRAGSVADVVEQPTVYVGNGGLPMHAHFLMDVVGKLGFLGPLDFTDRILLLPGMATPAQLDDVARVYAIPRDRIKVYDEHRPLHFKELHILPIGKMPPWMAPEMVDFLRRGLARARFPEGLDPAAHKRLFVGRGRVEGGPRRLLNEAELRSVALDAGYVEIEPSDYTLEEEIALFANADEVIVVYGSACGNVVFCRPDARVLIVQSDAMTEKTFGMACGLLGITYGYVFGSSYHRWQRAHNSDWVIDPDLVSEAIRLLRR